MKAWFYSLAERERVMVAAAAIFIVFAAFWFGVWTPLDAGQQQASIRVDAWQRALTDLRPLKGQIQAEGASQPIAAGQNQSLIVIVDNTLRQRGLYGSLQRSQPTPGGNGIRVEFSNVSFDTLMLWLGDINRQYGLLVQSANFSIPSGGNPGRVTSTLTLER